MGVDHGGTGTSPPRIWSGGLSPQILSCCKILSTRLLALQCRKMYFCLYSRTFIVSPAMRPPRIPVRFTPMSMSCECRSLKKSSSDCLKLAKQWYSIWVKWCYFWWSWSAIPAFSQVVQKHYLSVVGNYSICWLLIFSVTCVPNMKIRECFLKLQLKIAGMFFETQCILIYQLSLHVNSA